MRKVLSLKILNSDNLLRCLCIIKSNLVFSGKPKLKIINVFTNTDPLEMTSTVPLIKRFGGDLLLNLSLLTFYVYKNIFVF